jgi:hypothetical protein
MIEFKTIAAVMLATCLAFPLSQAAMSACTQGELAGSWQVYSFNSESVWATCRISVNSTGVIATTTCTSQTGQSASFTNGKITLTSAPNCTFKGSFRLGGQLNTVKHSTMSRDKILVQGVGTYSGGSFNFNMTKI